MTVSVKKMPNGLPRAAHVVVAIAYDRLCTFEFGIAVEVFGLERPEMGEDWYQFQVCAVDDGPLRATGGIRIVVDGGLELLETAATIVVPGWRGADEPVPEALCDALRRAHQRGARLMSICSGVFVLAAAGLLDGRRATTHWRYTDILARDPAIHVEPDVLYVEDGQVFSSAGSAAGLDLCLHIVRQDFGPEAANKVARRLVIPPHRDGGQAQYIERPVPRPYEGARLSPMLEMLRERIAERHTIEDLAAGVGMSVRTFIRRFKETTGTTPGEWLQSERLARARELLEHSAASVDDVAETCGFGSAATLRHHFRRRFGTSPAAYRNRFRASAAG